MGSGFLCHIRAHDGMVLCDAYELLGLLLHSTRAGGGIFAALCKPAAGLRVNGARQLADDQFTLLLRVVQLRHGDRLQKRLRIRMDRVFEQRRGRRLFNALAEIHDTDIVRNVLDDRKVVRNEKVCEAQFVL